MRDVFISLQDQGHQDLVYCMAVTPVLWSPDCDVTLRSLCMFVRHINSFCLLTQRWWLCNEAGLYFLLNYINRKKCETFHLLLINVHNCVYFLKNVHVLICLYVQYWLYNNMPCSVQEERLICMVKHTHMLAFLNLFFGQRQSDLSIQPTTGSTGAAGGYMCRRQQWYWLSKQDMRCMSSFSALPTYSWCRMRIGNSRILF